jgi:hypothetical protein
LGVAIGLAVFLLGLPVIVLAGVIAAISVPLGIVIGILAVGALIAVGSAVSGVFQAALYRYATSGTADGAFHVADLQSSFRPRKR